VAYVQLFNTGLLIWIAGWTWWYLALVPVLGTLYYFETKFGIPGELDVAWKSSKEWQEFKRDFYELRDRLNEVYPHFK
jgi:hypothetical protein